ncbi:asparagine synthase-related protein [Streptomyces sp. NPDC088789]|uniref:asparagine synthase-related protein n=1 Tax=Streptomyces sp. NPDC088789 TaxID=3365899 RepID=UPI0038286A2A
MMDQFVVVPDHEVTSAVGCLPWQPSHTIHHVSGRPWILARLTASSLTHIHAGGNTVVLIGPGEPASPALERTVAGCRTATDLDRIVTDLPGLFHVIAAIGTDGVRIQGTASGVRQVFYTRYRDGWWASDRARTLAEMTGAQLDKAALALRLLEPMPHPLGRRALWEGIHTLPGGSWLHLDAQGHQRIHRWWQPPQPLNSLPTGAQEVRSALQASVRLHLRDRTRVSSELSGGFDSTALLFLAAQERSVLAVTAESRDPLDDDREWAELAVRHSGRITHHVVAAHDVPLVYADLDRAVEPLDEPSPGTASRARVLAMTAPGRAAGADVHLTGHGGDHLFVGLATLWADLLPSRPLTAIRCLAAYRGMFRWSWADMARQLLPVSYREWLASRALSGTGTDSRFPFLTWGLGAGIPPWTTPEGASMIREEVSRAAQTATPLAKTPGGHLELDGIQDGARLVRALTDITAHAGLPLSAPFFDDRVIEAALRVRVPDRVQPYLYKPVLAEAMRGVVPDALLRRTTKGVGNMAQALGLRIHAEALSELWSECRLADRGLVDAAYLRKLSANPASPELDDGSLLTTVACELWLRTLEN